MATPAAPTAQDRRRARFWRRVWKALNSTLLITLISAVTAALLTNGFASRQAESQDIAARRAELSRDLVELELRTARLHVIEAQAEVARTFTPTAMAHAGERAKAIVGGDSRTVTSDPAFKDIHLVTVLGRAETAAGVDLSDKSYMLDFTDRDDLSAVAFTGYILCRANLLVYYLKQHFQSGEFPLKQDDKAARSRDSAVYTAINASSSCKSPLASGRDPRSG